MTQPPSTKDFDKGLATRKQVMGEDFVANAFGKVFGGWGCGHAGSPLRLEKGLPC